MQADASKATEMGPMDQPSSSNVYETIFQHLPDGIVVINRKGYTELMNPAASAILGVEIGVCGDETAEGRVLELLGGQEPSRGGGVDRRLASLAFGEQCSQVMHSGVSVQNVCREIRRADGAARVLSLSATPIVMPGQLEPRCLITIRDHTDAWAFERELWRAANHDTLTGAYNRRFADEILSHEIHRVDDDAQPLSLMVFDIDRFKAVNDRYGHEAGDEVLRQVSALVQRRVRVSDYFIRWGGEEFVILMPDTDLAGATTLAEELRDLIAQTPFGEVGSVGISAGVGEYQRGESLRDWFRRTDEALYAAKVAGRGRVYAAGSASTA